MANIKGGAAAVEQKNSPSRPSAKQSKASGPKQAKGGKPGTKKENIFQRFVNYLKNVRLEIKRTTWPTRNDVLRMSLIVMGALLFFFIMIMVIDQIMTYLIDAYAGLASHVQASTSSFNPAILPTPDATSTASAHSLASIADQAGKSL
ncbi:MAG: preprotein translocase subunit SecE [Coriobacteriia bacterium]|nr:preprotein translocase subunit SecE [Coriobacteriia bacterium]